MGALSRRHSASEPSLVNGLRSHFGSFPRSAPFPVGFAFAAAFAIVSGLL